MFDFLVQQHEKELNDAIIKDLHEKAAANKVCCIVFLIFETV
jgi:hypothetical protein